jgi:hypothetical protein
VDSHAGHTRLKQQLASASTGAFQIDGRTNTMTPWMLCYKTMCALHEVLFGCTHMKSCRLIANTPTSIEQKDDIIFERRRLAH